MNTSSSEQNRTAQIEHAQKGEDLAASDFTPVPASDSQLSRTSQKSVPDLENQGRRSLPTQPNSKAAEFAQLPDGSFASIGPDSTLLNRFDQPTLVGLLLIASLCLIGWSTWQWLSSRARTIDIDEVRRTQLRFEVDLNRASAAELANLPGVGPKLAEEIVAYRTENGRFTRFEDLLSVSGIGEAKYKAILPFLRSLEPSPATPEIR